jgi:serine/threonine protein kinase
MEREFAYVDFDLLIDRGGPDSYRARVLRSPAGECAPVQFTLPFSPVDLENIVLKVERGRRRARGPGRPESAPLKEFGSKLYSAVFQDELRDTLQRSLSLTRAQRVGLRLRLRLADTPELAGLPWEFLYDPRHNRFLAQSRHSPLVRYLDLPDPPRPLSVEGPLRVMVMISSPSDYPELDVEQEWSLLTGALAEQLAERRVIIERLPASMSALRGRLRREDFHVFHFVGHGFYRGDWGNGVLVMEDRNRRSHEVTGEELGSLLSEYDQTRLAVLNACEGARSDASDLFAGMAQSLIQQGLPAVVAMQFEITDAAAIIFAREFYGAIADGYPLEAALAEARGAIRDEGNPTEWGTPVLYSRAPDGRLFNVTGHARQEAERQAREEEARLARDQIARHREAERAAAQRRQQIEQLQHQMRNHAATQDWDAVLTVSDQLVVLDPGAADPDALATTARDQITRHREAERDAEVSGLSAASHQATSEPDSVRFGPYILKAVLGRSGMSVVYRAYDTVKARTVALKVLIPELAADQAFQDRFRRGLRRAARLSESHIIPIHDFGQIDGRLFIDMRLVESIDLATLLEQDGPLPPPAAAWIIAQVASALDAAHAAGLTHRDVKPSNVLITGHAQSLPFAYLTDFGIASDSMGTLAAYMAPERIEGAPGDGRADVYSLACVLYECLTGRPPFTGEIKDIMWAHLNLAQPAPTAVRPRLPTAVDQVIARGMAKDPASRYNTAGELAAAILAATAPTPERSPHDTQRSWLALTASQVGAVHLAAGLPNQDAVAVHQIRSDVLVAALADGHGHHHPSRSARGALLAVTIACEAAGELAARLDGFKTAGQIASEVLRTLAPAITGRWRDAVRDDVAAHPFTSEEEALRVDGDNALTAYGSTLLLAIAGRKWLALAQIGDGDIVGIRPSGQSLLPMPDDPSLNGYQWASLCGARAEEDFRAGVVDVATVPLLGVLLATDGYGNAQVDDPWADGVSADLAELIGDHPPEWLASQLPLWAARCASAAGSADDTTITLLIAPSPHRR